MRHQPTTHKLGRSIQIFTSIIDRKLFIASKRKSRNFCDLQASNQRASNFSKFRSTKPLLERHIEIAHNTQSYCITRLDQQV